jgi:YidC/Oxa1 family membrane protein insertase
MASILYYLIIYPIEFIVDLVFTLMHMMLGNPGLSIVAVSVVINFLILPMYKRSDALQEKEREHQAKMSRWVSHIRRTFRGDERFMMLSEYYRQNHYRPLYALRGSISLLLQIPFFIAAYHYLSNLTLLTGTSFLNIRDLSRPDSLIVIGGLSVNVLPVLMTLINFLSGAIYTKGFPLKDKIQLYAMALVFLVLLYGSPSGLVLYWTCNNIFSLLKNIYYKKLLPLLRLRPAKKIKENADAENALHSRPVLFLLGGLFITLLTGILIPSSVIVSSPPNSCRPIPMRTRSASSVSSVSIAAGLFLVWGGILYYLMKDGLRQKTERMIFVLSGLFLTDYMFFGKKLGNLSSMLYFDDNPAFTAGELVTNLLVLLAVAAVFLFFWKKLRRQFRSFSLS